MSIRVCATCRHLAVGKTAREFEKIADTEYTEFTCRVLEWTTREFYLMEPARDIDSASCETHCPYWEEWKQS
jgi:hypothetical protein